LTSLLHLVFTSASLGVSCTGIDAIGHGEIQHVAVKSSEVSVRMDDGFFDKLDRFDHATRVTTRQNRDVYNDSSAEYSAWDGPISYHHDTRHPRLGHPSDGHELTDEPLTLDSFGERSLMHNDQ
jgi:hypothetical protein